jgi:PhnB protein
MLNDPIMGAKSPKALGGSPAQLWIYVEDCDALFERALAAGAHVFGGATGKMTNQFWGDRSGTVVDPFGFKWSIATRKEDLSPKEMERRQNEFLKDVVAQPTSS